MVDIECVINFLKQEGVPKRLADLVGTDDFKEIENYLRENYGKVFFVRDNPFYFGAIRFDDLCLLLVPNVSKERYELFEIGERPWKTA